MKISIFTLVAVLSFITLTGFTCSKHVPEKMPETTSTTENKETGAVPQDQMTDQSNPAPSTEPTSGDATTTK